MKHYTFFIACVRAAVRFKAAGLVESSQQCDMQWLYDIHMGDMQYVCIGFKKKVIHSMQMYVLVRVCD